MNQTWMHLVAQIAIMVPAFLISVSFHEFCHAAVAFLLGDSTAQRAGRLTLNPLAHIDPLGVLFLIIFRIGWASPVPINQHNFKHPRIYSVISALAGPLSNLILATAALLCIKFFPVSLLSVTATTTSVQFLKVLTSVNIMLGVFNLLPIPPLDGSHIFAALLSKHFPQAVVWLYRYSLFILLAVLMLPQTQQLLRILMRDTERYLKALIF